MMKKKGSPAGDRLLTVTLSSLNRRNKLVFDAPELFFHPLVWAFLTASLTVILSLSLSLSLSIRRHQVDPLDSHTSGCVLRVALKKGYQQINLSAGII